jgi:DNA-binding NarL/FixJ family response regulator
VPEMSDGEVIEEIFEIDPSAKTLLYSGDSDKNQHKNIIDLGTKDFIGEPFKANKPVK